MDETFHKTIHAICMHYIHPEFDKAQALVADYEAESCEGISRSNNVNTEYEIQAAANAAGVDVM